MGKKVVTSIRVDKDTLRRAKEVGLNVSKISENALKMAIERLEPLYSKSKAKLAPNNSEDSVWWGRPDSNRGPERPRLRAWTMLADGPLSNISQATDLRVLSAIVSRSLNFLASLCKRFFTKNVVFKILLLLCSKWKNVARAWKI
jgi:hypothetical protein